MGKGKQTIVWHCVDETQWIIENSSQVVVSIENNKDIKREKIEEKTS